MPNLLTHMMGKILGRPAAPERPAERQKLEFVRGGPNAPELGPMPVDGVLDDIDGNWIGQVKVDGVRAFYIDGRIVTREGVPLDCALHCLPGLVRVEEAFGQAMVIDGEYVEEEGFDATVAALKKGEGAGVFWMFDAVPFSEWERDRCTEGTAMRLAKLRRASEAAESPFVGLLHPFGLNGTSAIRAKVSELWRAKYEGIVLKDPDAPYRRRREPRWIRIKEEVTLDCPIVDILVKDDTFKGLIVRGEEGPIKVTAGFSNIQKKQFYQLALEGGEGAIVEVKYNRKAGSSRPRHAVFVRSRPDKKVHA